MKVLVTGSSGHLGEALVRVLSSDGIDVVGIDCKAGSHTHHVGTIVNREWLSECMRDVTVVLHTATLHKPHVATHKRQDFVDTNITGTLNLLECAVSNGVDAFVMTSTTSTFGDAMRPQPGDPAVWVTEDLVPKPRNIYGITKTAAEDLCVLFHRNQKLNCLVLRTSRFFPEPDDSAAQRDQYADTNLKVNELLYRRVDIQDVVDAHRLAIAKAPGLGFGRYIISATPPFCTADLAALGQDAPSVVKRYVPDYEAVYQRRGWRMLPALGRVYDNRLAREELGWNPQYTFAYAIRRLAADKEYRSDLTLTIGAKGYHDQVYTDGLYPVEYGE
ncbi:MAG: NAD(P)-dependent oxidoreductase [Gammaproteobacteria bacterium]|nr:NAD(P)-dependent oxidoreductase [Gammaproteobacteria bacterium]